MPDPFDRHSRPNGCCESWYGQPARSQLRDAAVAEQAHPEVIPQGKRPPGKKDRNLCKAAHWKGPHQPEIRMRKEPFPGRAGGCHWATSWVQDKPVWVCRHEEACAGCGKVLRDSIGRADCPDFRPITDEEQAAIAAEIERREGLYRTRSRKGRQVPVITGPQGYRRKRSA